MTVLDKHLPKAIDEWGMENSFKFIIGCKATSIGEANKIASKLGLEKDIFTDVRATGNIVEIRMIDKLGFTIRPLKYYEEESIDIRRVL